MSLGGCGDQVVVDRVGRLQEGTVTAVRLECEQKSDGEGRNVGTWTRERRRRKGLGWVRCKRETVSEQRKEIKGRCDCS